MKGLHSPGDCYVQTRLPCHLLSYLAVPVDIPHLHASITLLAVWRQKFILTIFIMTVPLVKITLEMTPAFLPSLKSATTRTAFCNWEQKDKFEDTSMVHLPCLMSWVNSMIGQAKCQPAPRDWSHKPQKTNSSACPDTRAYLTGGTIRGEILEEEVTVLNLLKNGAGIIKNRGACVHGLD